MFHVVALGTAGKQLEPNVFQSDSVYNQYRGEREAR